MTSSRTNLLLQFATITVLILTVYGNTLNHGFVWDDIDIIVRNTRIESLGNIPGFFLSEDKVDTPTGYYRPITYVSFTLDRVIWGLKPRGFTITNLILHCSVSLALYLVVSELFKREWYAFLTALIFALHPIANETVNFHSGGRNTLLCALFALLSFFFHMRRKHPAALACLILAIFSKEFALLMPLLFLFHDRFISDDKPPRKPYISYIAALICYLAVRSYAVAAPNFMSQLKIVNLPLLTPRLVIGYLANMLLPFRIKTMYEVRVADHFRQIIPYLLTLLLLAIAARRFRGKKELLFSTSWFFLFMLPVSGILPLGITTMADRYAYFSSMGFAMALAYVVSLADRKSVVAITVFLCAWYATIDVQRNSYWKDEFSLFTQMIKDVPRQAIGYQNLGLDYYDKGDLNNAVKYLSVASTKEAVTARMLAGSAAVFREAKQYDKAVVALTLAGEKLLAQQDLAMAERSLKEALGLDPSFIPALIDMGSMCAEKGEYNRSLQYYSRASSLDPSNPAIHYNLSVVYDSLGKHAEAQTELTTFKELDGRSGQKRDAPRQ